MAIRWMFNLAALFLVFWCCGCVSGGQKMAVEATSGPSTEPAGSQEPQTVKSAFMIKEAKLPAGFPPPGKVGQVMVKRYPAYRAARVQSERVANGGLNEMFGPLFNHIKRRGIEMTSPVEITYALGPVEDGEAKPAQMAFLYGTPETGEAGSDGIVEVLDVGEMTVASVAVRGSYNSRTYRLGMEQLRRWLDENRGRYEADGRPRFLGYNSPFVPWFMKLGEVQVPVRAVGDLAGF